MTDTENVPGNVQTIEEMLNSARALHASITELADTAKTAAAAVFESHRSAVSNLAEAQTKMTDISTASTKALAAMKEIADNQAVIATKSDHIQKAQEHADTVRAELDRKLTAATQQATEAEGQKDRAQSATDAVTELLAETRTAKGAADKEGATIKAACELAEKSAATTKQLADKSEVVEKRVAEYEQRLADFGSQSEEQLKKIESLLPGATSAGLAHAFNERRKTFLKPHNHWQWLFVTSVLALVALAITGLVHVYQTGITPSWDELVRLWICRLPVAAALVWLALHASRESALAKRLEEDYGYKSAIASCFEGFQKQMSEVGKEVDPTSALAKLLENTLATIALPPGRIYDSHKLTVSPTDELKEVAKAAVDVANAAKPGGKQ